MNISQTNPGRSLADIYTASSGFVSYNAHPVFNGGGNNSLSTQVIYATAVPYRAGQVVANICWIVSTAGIGTPPTNIFCGISDAAIVRGLSADVKAGAYWVAQGLAAVPLISSYTIPTDGLYYHLVLANGTWSGTQMQLQRLNGVVFANGTTLFGATGGTGQTTIPAVGQAITLANASSPGNFMSAST